MAHKIGTLSENCHEYVVLLKFHKNQPKIELSGVKVALLVEQTMYLYV